ncbi:hypothetical protein [Tahibacter amnicola]|uniref:Uncharacterized protein n=1 Tax=Tahibacter amnicola TaxID=2976241 RepID=A0ABY6B6T5_9GAMM|nr:hypothetical protein [Tahibacter amnicola]UXI65813.1 hypothetical protein N4264_13680 [Tahibacter amnicola]
MRRNRAVSAFLSLLLSTAASAETLGTGFTYQGDLTVNGAPATGSYDLKFLLFAVPTGGMQAATVTVDDVAVVQGVFTTGIDFTDVPFQDGQQYWIEVRVREGTSTGTYQPLLPRQAITATPVALSARNVLNGGVTQASIAPAAVGSTQLAVNAVTGSKIVDGSITATKLAFAAGDITGVTAGSGLTGGGTTGDVTLAVNPAVVQMRISGTCATGQYLRGVHADGSLLCDVIPGVANDSTNVVNGAITQSQIGLAIPADGLPVISYTDAASQYLRLAKCADSACRSVSGVKVIRNPQGASVQGDASDIALDADGIPVISFYDPALRALKIARCADPVCEGNASVELIDDDATGTLGQHSSLVLDANGYPLVSYWDAGNGDLKFIRCQNATCSLNPGSRVIDQSASTIVGEYSSIILDLYGHPVISYYDRSNGALKIASCTTDSCGGTIHFKTVDEAGSDYGSFSAMVRSADNRPLVSFFDNTAKLVKVAACDLYDCSGNITVTTIDGGPGVSVSGHTTIANGNDGLPIIGYAVGPQVFAFKVTKCGNTQCTQRMSSSVVDGVDFTPHFPDIAIGPDGLPLVVGRNSGNGYLRAAKCGTRSCQ